MSTITIGDSDAAFTLNDLARQIHDGNLEAGWWPQGQLTHSPDFYAMKIALIHSEVSEMLEGLRKGIPDDHLPHRSMEEAEAADVLIRLLDYAAARGLDLDAAVAEKLEYNRRRQDHQRTARAAVGGKSF